MVWLNKYSKRYLHYGLAIVSTVALLASTIKPVIAVQPQMCRRFIL